MSLSNTVTITVRQSNASDPSQTSFDLDYAMIDSANLVALNIGVFTAQSVPGTGLYYSCINGAGNALRDIELRANGKVIGRTPYFRKYSSIQNVRTSNQGSEDLSRFDLLNGMGLSLSAGVHERADNLSESWTMQSRFKDYSNTYPTNGRPFLHNQIRIAAADLTQSGALKLSNYIDMLVGSPILPPMRNLQVILYWDTTATNFVQDPNADAAVGNPAYTHTTAQLLVEKILQPNPTGPVKFSYTKVLAERFNMDAVADGVYQEQTFDSQAFLGRFVKRLCFVNQLNTDDGWMNRQERSPAMFNESLNMNVNYRPFLPPRGLCTPAKRIQSFTETYGSINMPLAAASPRVAGILSMFSSDSQNAASQTSLISHNFSIAGVEVGMRIEQMAFTFSRVGNSNNAANSGNVGTASVDQIAAYSVIVFGECAYEMTVYPDGRIVEAY